jgi:CubicO group peptidase (beta-lactamase class C family)
MLRLLLLLTIGALALPAQPAQQPSPADLAVIDAYVESRWRETSSPGLAYAIVRDGALLHAGGFGHAGAGRAATPTTAFGIGSMTKSFTALAVLQLVDAGQVELDAPVQRYLPWFRLADPKAAARITVRQLLNQTSGLPTYAGFWRDPAGGAEQLARRVQALADVAPVAEPGATFTYSNANFDLAGLIVQTVSGRPYETYVAEAILAPLGMDASFFPSAERSGDIAQGHQDWLGLALPAGTTVDAAMWPAGGLYSSAEDLARYLAAQLDGGRSPGAVLSSAGFAELHRAAAEAGSDYALGWDTETIAGVKVVEHGGASPGFHSSMLFAPGRNLGVVVLSNVNAAPMTSLPAGEITAGILTLLVGAEPQAGGLGLRTGLALKLGLLALTVWGLVSLPRDVARVRRKLAAGVPGRRLALDAGLSLGMGLFLLIGLPRMVGTPLWAMWLFNPDMALLVIVGAATALLVAALQGEASLRGSRQRRQTGAEALRAG